MSLSHFFSPFSAKESWGYVQQGFLILSVLCYLNACLPCQPFLKPIFYAVLLHFYMIAPYIVYLVGSTSKLFMVSKRLLSSVSRASVLFFFTGWGCLAHTLSLNLEDQGPDFAWPLPVQTFSCCQNLPGRTNLCVYSSVCGYIWILNVLGFF